MIAGAVGALLTGIMILLASYTDPHNNPYPMLLLFISIPSLPIYCLFKIFGCNLLVFATTTEQGGFSVSCVCMFVISNSISYSMLGTLLGWVIKNKRNKSHE